MVEQLTMVSLEEQLLLNSFKTVFLGAAGSGGESFWIAKGYYSVSNRFLQPRDIAVDSENNVYVVGLTRDTVGSTSGFLAKFDTEGTSQYFKLARSGNSPSTVRYFRCKMDSNDNLYVAGNGYYLVSGSTGQDLHLTKYDTSDGSITWTRDSAYTYQNNITDFHSDLISGNIDIDPNDDYPSVSYTTSDTQRGLQAHIAEWTDSGSHNNDVLINAGGTQTLAIGSFKRSGDWHGILSYKESDNAIVLVQLDSANIFLSNYKRKINRSGADIYPYDSNGSGNTMYVCGKMVSSGNHAFIGQFYPSTGNGTTSATIPASSYTSKYNDFRRVWYDAANGNVWAITGNGQESFDIVKFNTSLVMQGRYQISESNNKFDESYKSITTDSAGNVYIAIVEKNVDGMALFKLPPDLSVSGTFDGITIATSTTDISNTNLSITNATLAASGLSVADDTVSAGSQTFTESNGSWTLDNYETL